MITPEPQNMTTFANCGDSIKIRLNQSRVAPNPQRPECRNKTKMKAEFSLQVPVQPPRNSRETSHPQSHKRREQLLLGATRGTSPVDTCSQTFCLRPRKQALLSFKPLSYLLKQQQMAWCWWVSNFPGSQRQRGSVRAPSRHLVRSGERFLLMSCPRCRVGMPSVFHYFMPLSLSALVFCLLFPTRPSPLLSLTLLFFKLPVGLSQLCKYLH